MHAEVEILSPSPPPSYVPSRTLQHNVDEILRWLKGNYVRIGEEDYGFLLDDYENSEELKEEIELHDATTAELVKQAWGLFVSITEFDQMVKIIDEDNSESWLPDDHLVEVTEIDEDDDVTVSLESLKDRVPTLISRLAELEQQLPRGIGHNGPPEQLVISRDTIRELSDALAEFEEIEEEDLPSRKSWIKQLAENARTVARAVVQYSSKLADEFAVNAATAAGEQFGKWGTRAAIFVLLSNFLANFADDLLRLIGS